MFTERASISKSIITKTCNCLLNTIVSFIGSSIWEDVLWASGVFTKIFTYLDFIILIKDVSKLKHETVTIVAMKNHVHCINAYVFVTTCVCSNWH